MNNLGLLYIDAGQFDRAEPLYRRALDLVPDYAEAWNNLGMLYARTERPDEAMDALGEALRLSETPMAHRNMAWVLLALGRRDEAKAHLEQARQLSADAASGR
jgi:tetratricopeptide (TPR) repeat protein